jgi:hypothetical protein
MAIPRIYPIYKPLSIFAFIFISILVSSIFCPVLSAQSKLKLPAVEVFGGYSYLRFESTQLGFANRLNLNGAIVEVSLPDLYEGFGIAADVSGHFAHEMEEFNFLIGPQYAYSWKGLRLTGHALFGKSRDRLLQPGTTQLEPSNLGRGIALGGSLDFSLSDRLSVRPIQADYLITNFFGSTQHNVRLSTGLIFRFGKR